MGFPGGSNGKESTCNVGDVGSISVLERSPLEGKGYLLQYSGLDRGAWRAAVYRISKSLTLLSDFDSLPSQEGREGFTENDIEFAWWREQQLGEMFGEY